MHKITVVTRIAAPLARCFDLARSVDAHLVSAASTGERVVQGRQRGLLEPGEPITWEARHLGVRQRLTSEITRFDPPGFFQDRMVRGAFKHFEHDHRFEPDGSGGTVMRDDLRFVVPGGPVGKLFGVLVIGPHLRRFLSGRGLAMKPLAESGDWRGLLGNDHGYDPVDPA